MNRKVVWNRRTQLLSLALFLTIGLAFYPRQDPAPAGSVSLKPARPATQGVTSPPVRLDAHQAAKIIVERDLFATSSGFAVDQQVNEAGQRGLFPDPGLGPPQVHQLVPAPWRLVGIAHIQGQALAPLAQGEAEAQYYQEGDRLPDGSILVAIEQERVILATGRRQYHLELAQEFNIVPLANKGGN